MFIVKKKATTYERKKKTTSPINQLHVFRCYCCCCCCWSSWALAYKVLKIKLISSHSFQMKAFAKLRFCSVIYILFYFLFFYISKNRHEKQTNLFMNCLTILPNVSLLYLISVNYSFFSFVDFWLRVKLFFWNCT